MKKVKVNVADFRFEFEADVKAIASIFQKHACDKRKIDKTIKVNESDIENEKIFCESDKEVRYKTTYILSAIHRKISEWITKNNAFIFHSATFDVDGVGVAFAAQSGTGKTTQMLNWQKHLGDRMTIVNGDKPIIRFFDKDFCEQKGLDIPEGTEFGVPYAYGTPWNGKENLGNNTRTVLKHICFIERSETNFVTKIDKADAVERIMKQVYIPSDPEALEKTLQLVNRFINACELWIIHCNTEPESAEVAYKTIFGTD